MKQKFLLLASAAIGLLAAFLAHAWLSAKNREVEAMKAEIRAGQRMVKVFVAARPLPADTVVTHDDIATLSYPERLVTRDNVGADDGLLVVGRRLLRPVDLRGPILWSYVEGGRGSERSLAESVQRDMRAVSIPVSGPAAVSGLVRPGDHVDVLGSSALPADAAAAAGPQAETEMVTMTILQNVAVLATGTETARGRSQRPGSTGYGAVTLLATPREAEILVFAQQMKGRLFLTLRNPGDTGFEKELPQIDFRKIREELEGLNAERQKKRP